MYYVWFAVVLVLLIIYISYYYRYPSGMSILQTTASNFYFDMLREKQPIVVQDPIADVDSLAKTWFGWNNQYPFELVSSDDSNVVWIRNKYKFTMLHSSEPCEILLSPAKSKIESDNSISDDATIVAISLSARQVVIIPYRMHYAVIHAEKRKVHCIGIHDLVTYVLP
jgi:hypothetical protein